MGELTLSVPDISCEHCERAIRQEVLGVAGVASVDVDIATKRVTVRGDGVGERAVRAAVEEAGYSPA